MARVALYTFGILKGAYQSEALTEFAGMARMIFPTLGGADGFIAQAGDARPDLLGRAGHGEDFGPWGVYVAPRFFDARWQASGASMVQTLSLWRDCEAARRFAYNGLHRDALKPSRAPFQGVAMAGLRSVVGSRGCRPDLVGRRPTSGNPGRCGTDGIRFQLRATLR